MGAPGHLFQPGSASSSSSGAVNAPAFVQFATVTNLTSNTYNNGTNGVGATITSVANETLGSAQGELAAAVAGDLILVQFENTPANNGVYTVTSVGSGGSKWVLTRTPGLDTIAALQTGFTVFVVSGSTNRRSHFQQLNVLSAIGSSSLVFENLTAGLVVVERYVAPTDITSKTFTGLNGDVDEIYFMSWSMIKATSTNSKIFIQPQGSGSNLNSAMIASVNGAAPVGGGGVATWFVHQNNSGNASDPWIGQCTFHARVAGSAIRLFQAETVDYEGGSGPIMRKIFGYYNDTTTAITSLKILCDVSSGIKAGSLITLYKRRG